MRTSFFAQVPDTLPRLNTQDQQLVGDLSTGITHALNRPETLAVEVPGFEDHYAEPPRAERDLMRIAFLDGLHLDNAPRLAIHLAVGGLSVAGIRDGSTNLEPDAANLAIHVIDPGLPGTIISFYADLDNAAQGRVSGTVAGKVSRYEPDEWWSGDDDTDDEHLETAYGITTDSLASSSYHGINFLQALDVARLTMQQGVPDTEAARRFAAYTDLKPQQALLDLAAPDDRAVHEASAPAFAHALQPLLRRIVPHLVAHARSSS